MEKFVDLFSDLEEQWRIVDTSGVSVRGRFGHSASYDYLTNAVYIYGGYTLGGLADDLLIFGIGLNKWYVSDRINPF